jgi:uncharacterized damage-inducible protein DinB
MISSYRTFAGYNAWCNERLYDAAATLLDTDYRADRGAFFKSLHGTLNHLLVGDRIWMIRFTGEGELPKSLDTILYENFDDLRAARRAEDAAISRYVAGLSEAETHHRGQAHALLSSFICNDRTPSFDLIIYQRETGQGGLRKLA